MAQRKELTWSQLRVGLTVGLSLIVVALAIFFIGGQVGIFGRTYSVKAFFADASGLSGGAAVQLAGIPVGNVSKLTITNSTQPGHAVEVVLKISRKYQDQVRSDSVATIETAGLLGQSFVNVTRGTPGKPVVPPGGEVKTEGGTDIKKIVANTNDVLVNLRGVSEQLSDVAHQISSGKGSIGELIYNEDLYRRMDRATASLQQVANNLSEGHGTLGKLVYDDTTYNKLNATLDRVNAIVDNVQNGKGSLGKLLNDPTLYNNLESAASKANTLVDNVNQGKGTLGQLLTSDQLYDRINTTVSNLNTISTRIVQGQGTLGMLSTDKTLYNNLSASSESLREFLTEFRKNPKKYLTLRIHIF
jgi:phospholipid/cholesterol/gamma-HCH transport system substrate-binding protein